MTTFRIAPALAEMTIHDLADRIAHRPSGPDHHSGASAAGHTRFPGSWTRELVAGRAAELVADAPGTGWRSVGNRRILHRRYDDLWLLVLAHSTAPTHTDCDPNLQVISAFPHDSGSATPPGPSSLTPLYSSVFDHAWRAFDELGNMRASAFRKSAAWLRDGGLIAESLVWLMLCRTCFPVQFGEDTWATLYALAVDGLFDECPGFDALTHIETQWAVDYPATWGLTHATLGRDGPVLVDPARMPGDDETVRAVHRWLEAALPRHLRSHPETRVGADRRTGDAVSVTVEIPRGHASLVLSGVRDDPSCGFGEVSIIEPTAHPCDRLAGLILTLAISELLGGDRGYIAFPEPFAAVLHTPDLLQSETSQLDLRRLVLLDVDAHR